MSQLKADISIEGAEKHLELQRHAFLEAGPPSRSQRKASLTALKDSVLRHRTDIEAAISADFGNRPAYETGIMELSEVISAIDYLSKNLKKFMAPEKRSVAKAYWPSKAWVEYQPKGVIGIMAPWNYPFSLTMVPLATALAAGNRAMIKPSELTPRTSDVIVKILADAFSQEEVSVVLGGKGIGAKFSALPFDHLFFTGSTAVGKKIMAAASENLVPVTLELGGKSPAVFQKGQITERNVSSVVFGKLANAGQTCVAPDYVMVHEDELGDFITKYGELTERFYPDGPTSKDYTTIISDGHFERLTGLIESARDDGTRVIEVGVKPEDAKKRDRTIAPTLVVDPTEGAAVMEEEIFGPVLPVIPYADIDEAIAFINARPRPLALYFLGEDGEERAKLKKHTISGSFGINNTIMHVAQDDIPFGGVGASGMGSYHGVEGFRTMSHGRAVFEQGKFSLPRFLHAPFGKFTDLALSTSLGRR